MLIKLMPIFALLIFSMLETLIPLQRVIFSKLSRFITNLSMGLTGYMLSAPLSIPLLFYITERNSNLGLGIQALELGPLARVLLSLVVLDASIYYWHRLNHIIPLLWRFHIVHHIDTEMDAGTALRFHFGELIFSTFYKAFIVFIFGISLLDLVLFESLVTACALFHHSNINLPTLFEKLLNLFMVTPKMHQLHHSRVRLELDSNYGTISSVWDRINRSYSAIEYPRLVKLGVPGYNNQSEQTVKNLLAMPFRPLTGDKDE